MANGQFVVKIHSYVRFSKGLDQLVVGLLLELPWRVGKLFADDRVDGIVIKLDIKCYCAFQ